MGIVKTIRDYHMGMATYDICHKPSLVNQWDALRDEVAEFLEQPSLEEASDVLHSVGRIVWKLTCIPLYLLAWPTVCKHSQRFACQGCIRSSRNCEGRCTSLATKIVN